MRGVEWEVEKRQPGERMALVDVWAAAGLCVQALLRLAACQLGCAMLPPLSQAPLKKLLLSSLTCWWCAGEGGGVGPLTAAGACVQQ
jgi:hypothetical protein